MKNLILLLISCFSLYFTSCKQNKKVESSNINDTIVQDFTVKDFDLEKAASQKNMTEKQYSFYSYRKCDSAVSLQDIRKYKKREILNTKKEIIKDSIYISFTFIDDCCREYIGHLNLYQDTIKLSYENVSRTPCDCYCKYSYAFSLPKKIYEGKNIFLNDIKYQQ